MRSRNAKPEFEGRDGVVSGAGDAVLSRLRGDRNGICDVEALERLECVEGGLVRA